jgi:putative ABC transport system permease protein
MYTSEIKAAVRTFYREKAYAIINLFGLSIAMACCLILGLYIKSELTYDMHNERYKEIYRIVGEYTTSGNTARYAVTPVPLGPLLVDGYPEVKDFVRLSGPARYLIRSEDKAFFWDRIYLVDQNIFDIFTHEIIYGDPKTALTDPSSAAVSESFAKKYFGDTNPIGKTIHADRLIPAIPRKITLVFQDLPDNTHLKYDVLFRLEAPTPERANPNALFNIGLYTYLIMPEDYDVEDFRSISDSFFKRHMENFGKAIGQTWNSWLEPLPWIHLHSGVDGDLPGGNLYYIYGFTAVALFILLVACINYVNLAIARATRRAKEIGMRKILGISRPLLISRFIIESVLFSMVALVFAILLAGAVLEYTPINTLLGKSLTLGVTEEPILWVWMFGLSLFIGILSGLYPALYLSSIAPLSALTDNYGGINRGLRLKEALVLVQFTVSVLVITCTLIMFTQMRFVSNKPLGFDKYNRLVVTMRGLDVIEKYPVIKKELLTDSHIRGITTCQFVVGTGIGSVLHSEVENEDGSKGKIILKNAEVGADFIESMGIELVSGRSFSKRLITDLGTRFVVNEAMVKKIGWINPLGKGIQMSGLYGKVIGVVKDYNAEPLHRPVEPLVLRQFNDDFKNLPAIYRPAIQRTMILHISENNVRHTLDFLQDEFAEFDPKNPFEYKFLDDTLDELYMSENHLMQMTGIFSGICIFISCLGLFGLAAITIEQRSREIAIRKVLGASALQIILMLSRRILWLVLAGSVVASIVAYRAMYEWLTGFAFRTSINPLVYMISTSVVIAVAFITIALQSYRIATANPADMIHQD